MIEYPEAATISQQMGAELTGKKITFCLRGNSPHKFAFYSYEPEGYKKVMEGAELGPSEVDGGHVMIRVGAAHTLVLGGGGEKIFLHDSDSRLPKKHHLLLGLDDGRYLTVTVQGWGMVSLLNDEELATHPYVAKPKVPPLSDDFTPAFFHSLFDSLKPDEKRSAKYFVISEPQIHGVGNGYLQDILFRAKIHPRRRVVELSHEERMDLYGAIRETLKQAVDQGGRDTEKDLYGNPGRYVPLMDRRTKGVPCTNCGNLIEKAAYLGGSVYTCPVCQTY
jgi:formamidopyrimidine-DNA glycosylase